MNKILLFFLGALLRIGFFLRYRVHLNGYDKLTKENLNRPGGVIFLPSHPAVFVDPALIVLAIWRKFRPRPLVVEYMYKTPIISNVLKAVNSIPIPDFDFAANALKKKQGDLALQQLIRDLKNGDNILFYPAARTKSYAKECIGGSSGLYQILQAAPETNVVLVRITGLWGSSFSRAYTGYAPPLIATIIKGIKTIFKNLIFFVPKRDVYINFEIAPPDFPRNAEKAVLNRWLENWYNRPDGLTKQEEPLPGDSLIRVSYSRWREELLEPHSGESELEKQIDLDKIPEHIYGIVYKKLGELSGRDPSTINAQMDLHQDLGMDSLDAAEMVLFLKDQFGVPPAPVMQLQNVKIVLGIASKQIRLELKEEDKPVDMNLWQKTKPKERVYTTADKTVIEAFLDRCDRMGNMPAMADATSGVVSYKTLKLRVIALAEYIRKLPGEYIGIMLPSSVAAYATFFAVQLAGKTPLMVNWTVGRRHFESVVKLSGVQVILSSWKFLDGLGSIDITGIEDQLKMLEDVRDEITLSSKIKAFFTSKKSTKKILAKLSPSKITMDSVAVLLFTSGSESMPKGVPLTHRNVCCNIRDAFETIPLFSDDIIFGVLPPFHSFGLIVCGVLSLVSGMRLACSPNPTDGVRMARDFAKWQPTIMVGAPLFIRTLARSSTAETLKSLRITVTGSEAAPIELFKDMEAVGKAGTICEGYGITECSPILTGNRPGAPSKGVGQPLVGVELMIVHPETYEPLPIGQRGLILAHGENVFSGYINPDIDAPFIEINGKKWYKTGDLGYLDEVLHLTISGRLKRFIKLGAEMMSLQAIEFGFNQKALENGWVGNPHETVHAAVCSKPFDGEKTKIYLFTSYPINLKEANDALKEAGFSNLVRFTEVIHVEKIPIMGTGKINYRILEEQIK